MGEGGVEGEEGAGGGGGHQLAAVRSLPRRPNGIYV